MAFVRGTVEGNPRPRGPCQALCGISGGGGRVGQPRAGIAVGGYLRLGPHAGDRRVFGFVIVFVLAFVLVFVVVLVFLFCLC